MKSGSIWRKKAVGWNSVFLPTLKTVDITLWWCRNLTLYIFIISRIPKITGFIHRTAVT